MFDLSTKRSSFVDTYGYWSFVVLIVLMPLAVCVSAPMSPMITKVAFGGTLVLITVLLYAIAHIKAQQISAPRSLLLGVAWLMPAAYLLSTLFAGEQTVSVYGERLTVDSLVFMLLSAAVLSVCAVMLTSQKRALGVYLAMLVAAVLVSVAELIIFFARETVASTGVVMSSLSLLGSLNDLAVFFGLIAIFVLLSLILLPVTSVVRSVLWVALFVSLYFLTVVNLTVLWWSMGLFALGCFVYSVSASFIGGSKRVSEVSYAALITVAVCALFLFGSESVTGKPAVWANVGELDVRPSWQTTMNIGRTTLADNLLFGVGPGLFEKAWSRNMPVEIHATEFWKTNFSFGIGLIPTSAITTGLVGALAWLVFLGLFLWTGVRSLVLRGAGGTGDIAYYLRVTSFLAALYLWIIAFIQVPSPALVLFAFIFTGVFIASLTFGANTIKEIRISFQDNARVGFLTTLALTVVVLLCIGGMYGHITRYMAELSFQKGVQSINATGNLEEGEQLILKALGTRPIDTHYRLLSNIDIARLEQLLSTGHSPEEVREEAQDLLARSIGNATKATEFDPQDHQNWTNLGSIYQNIIPLGIEGSHESARAAFDHALLLRPNMPHVHLAIATLEQARGKTDRALEEVDKALAVRGHYTDAIFLKAQLQLATEDVESAMRSVESITIIEPNNPLVFFQLGLLRYGSEDYMGAVQALERAVALNPVYANARYFLGLSYWRLDDRGRAVGQFEKVLETNPDNTEVRAIISNLRAGRDPFQSESAQEDVESHESLPEGEEEAKETNNDESPATKELVTE